MNRTSSRLLLIAILAIFAAAPAFAQSLNWDGQTGAFTTPFAYVTASPEANIGMPTVSYHLIDGGSVLGYQNMIGVNVGAFKRLEFGYSRNLTSEGNTAVLSSLFNNGYNEFQAKVNLTPENYDNSQLPAISIGVVGRSHEERAYDALVPVLTPGTPITDTNTYDIYAVATKTVSQFKPLPFVLNFGVKGTNAVVNGVAGAAQNWTPCPFGAAAIVVKAPFKTKAIFGAEASAEPTLKGLPTVNVPTTLDYFVRILPMPEKPINIDFGVAQVGGRVFNPLVQNLNARNQFVMGISYRL